VDETLPHHQDRPILRDRLEPAEIGHARPDQLIPGALREEPPAELDHVRAIHVQPEHAGPWIDAEHAGVEPAAQVKDRHPSSIVA
jgi:hypothetical protein